jgi:hypothetical protein
MSIIIVDHSYTAVSDQNKLLYNVPPVREGVASEANAWTPAEQDCRAKVAIAGLDVSTGLVFFFSC